MKRQLSGSRSPLPPQKSARHTKPQTINPAYGYGANQIPPSHKKQPAYLGSHKVPPSIPTRQDLTKLSSSDKLKPHYPSSNMSHGAPRKPQKRADSGHYQPEPRLQNPQQGYQEYPTFHQSQDQSRHTNQDQPNSTRVNLRAQAQGHIPQNRPQSFLAGQHQDSRVQQIPRPPGPPGPPALTRPHWGGSHQSPAFNNPGLQNPNNRPPSGSRESDYNRESYTGHHNYHNDGFQNQHSFQ